MTCDSPIVCTSNHLSMRFDINVLLDLIKRRSRAADVRRIISASFANSIRLFVAPEFIAELRKAGNEKEDDPILEIAATLHSFQAARH